MADEEPKIFIDEDWKAQVQREKEKARMEAESKPEAQEESGQDEPQQAPGMESPFQGLVSSLAAQTLFALGLIASPNTKEVMVDLEAAKAMIDMLMMLREKTQGNLTPGEESHLSEVLSELQRAYAARAQQVAEQTLRNSGIDPVTGQPKP